MAVALTTAAQDAASGRLRAPDPDTHEPCLWEGVARRARSMKLRVQFVLAQQLAKRAESKAF